MFGGIISSPSYSDLIQENIWRLNRSIKGNIQDNVLVWHIWFDPTLRSQGDHQK